MTNSPKNNTMHSHDMTETTITTLDTTLSE